MKYNDLLHTLNLYQITAKEHQVVDSWTADELSVLEILLWKYSEYVPQILRNCKKLKRAKIVGFTYSSILDVV